MIKTTLLTLFFASLHLSAQEIRDFNKRDLVELLSQGDPIHIAREMQDEQEVQRADTAITIISGCFAAMAGYAGGYLISSCHFLSDGRWEAPIGAIFSIAATNLLLQRPQVTQTVNKAYRSCTKRLGQLSERLDQLSEEFIQ